MEIDCEIYSAVILLLLILERFVVSYKRKHVRKVLVNCLGKLARKSVVRLTDCLGMTIAVDLDIKPNKQNT